MCIRRTELHSPAPIYTHSHPLTHTPELAHSVTTERPSFLSTTTYYLKTGTYVLGRSERALAEVEAKTAVGAEAEDAAMGEGVGVGVRGIVVDDENLSRVHAFICVGKEGSDVTITDDGSLNGSFHAPSLTLLTDPKQATRMSVKKPYLLNTPAFVRFGSLAGVFLSAEGLGDE